MDFLCPDARTISHWKRNIHNQLKEIDYVSFFIAEKEKKCILHFDPMERTRAKLTPRLCKAYQKQELIYINTNCLQHIQRLSGGQRMNLIDELPRCMGIVLRNIDSIMTVFSLRMTEGHLMLVWDHSKIQIRVLRRPTSPVLREYWE